MSAFILPEPQQPLSETQQSVVEPQQRSAEPQQLVGEFKPPPVVEGNNSGNAKATYVAS